jgi:hypothetical protein
MSLVIAFVGKKGAVIAGDMREIIFQGNAFSRKRLEKELYNGLIATDEEFLPVKLPHSRKESYEKEGCMQRQEIM